MVAAYSDNLAELRLHLNRRRLSMVLIRHERPRQLYLLANVEGILLDICNALCLSLGVYVDPSQVQ